MGAVKGSAPQVPWCVLYGWLQQGVQEPMGWHQAIDFYVLSRGSFRKKARNLIETAQRKSQLLSFTASQKRMPCCNAHSARQKTP